MRFIIQGTEYLQTVEFDDTDESVFRAAIQSDVEVHNSLHPEDLWTWRPESPPDGFKLVDSEFVPLTPQDLARSGKIDLAVLQSILCAMADGWFPSLLAHGFAVTGMSASNGRFSASDVLQSRATGVLSAVAAGIPVPFPLSWPDAQDEAVLIQTLDDFKILGAGMFDCVQAVSLNIGGIKSSIRAATDPGQTADLYDAWEASVKEEML